MVILFETIISWRLQRDVIVGAHFIVSSDQSTDSGVVYPNNIIWYVKIPSIYGKQNETTVDFTWPISEKSKCWHMTYFVRGPSEFCHQHMFQMYYGIWKLNIIFELGDQTNFEY